jgi:hypothetical protein
VFEVDYEVDFLGVVDGSHTEEAADVDDTDAAQLDIVPDNLRRAAYEGFSRRFFYFDRIVGDEPVTAFDELDCSFALADAAVAEEQKTFAVDLDKDAVPGDLGAKCRFSEAMREAIRGLVFSFERRMGTPDVLAQVMNSS